jgi:hypothetical protein
MGFRSPNIPLRKARHKSRGKTSGVGICTYFAFLFRANELAFKSRKLTDDQIAIMVEKEFPDRPSALVFRGPSKKRTINEYRIRYNTGRFTYGKTPELYSYRYNSVGDRVDGRTGKKVLPTIQELGLQSAHRYWRVKDADKRD